VTRREFPSDVFLCGFLSLQLLFSPFSPENLKTPGISMSPGRPSTPFFSELPSSFSSWKEPFFEFTENPPQFSPARDFRLSNVDLLPKRISFYKGCFIPSYLCFAPPHELPRHGESCDPSWHLEPLPPRSWNVTGSLEFSIFLFEALLKLRWPPCLCSFASFHPPN